MKVIQSHFNTNFTKPCTTGTNWQTAHGGHLKSVYEMKMGYKKAIGAASHSPWLAVSPHRNLTKTHPRMLCFGHNPRQDRFTLSLCTYSTELHTKERCKKSPSLHWNNSLVSTSINQLDMKSVKEICCIRAYIRNRMQNLFKCTSWLASLGFSVKNKWKVMNKTQSMDILKTTHTSVSSLFSCVVYDVETTPAYLCSHILRSKGPSEH